MWALYAVLSAVFAAATSLLAKAGLENVNSTLATAIRTGVVLVMAWVMVLVTGTSKQIFAISAKGWTFLVLSGLATGLSWLCYFHAIQIGNVSRVVPIDKLSVVITIVAAFIIFGEPVSVKSVIGCVLIACGTLVMVL